MTPNEHDDQAAAGPSVVPWLPPPGTEPEPRVPDVPPMERLPDAGKLPDPGYPVMPGTAGLEAGPVPEPEAGEAAEPRGAVESPGNLEPPASSLQPDAEYDAEYRAPVVDPYQAPRAPAEAPPMHGAAVPWSEVRQQDAPLGAPPPPPRQPAAETAGAPPPQHTRESAAALTVDALLPGKRATPGGGWRRTVYLATAGLIRVGEPAAQQRRGDLVARVRAPVASGHYRVAVLSLKGGVGKTTVSAGLGATLASLRGDRVIAVDGNPDRGTLSDKVRLETAATIRDLLNERAHLERYADVRAYTSQLPSRLEILASDRDPGVSVAFSGDDYRAVAQLLEGYYSICVTDCGTGLLHSAMAGILQLSDQIVVVSSASVDGARSAGATLDWLEAHDYADLVRDGVVVLSAVRRKSRTAIDLDRLEAHFAARCRAVVRVPYDPHLEEGAEVDLDLLNEETAGAYLELAALVADGFAAPRRPVSGRAPWLPLA